MHIYGHFIDIYIIKHTKLERFRWLICRIVDFSSLVIIEVIAKNVKIKKNPFWPNLLPHPLHIPMFMCQCPRKSTF